MNVYAFLFHFRKWVTVAAAPMPPAPARGAGEGGRGGAAHTADLTAVLNLAVVLDRERVLGTLKISGCATMAGAIYYYASGNGILASLAIVFTAAGNKRVSGAFHTCLERVLG
eukprot:1970357-Pyramimonas_sp.AAC.2